jgi:hypothetical protein
MELPRDQLQTAANMTEEEIKEPPAKKKCPKINWKAVFKSPNTYIILVIVLLIVLL